MRQLSKRGRPWSDALATKSAAPSWRSRRLQPPPGHRSEAEGARALNSGAIPVGGHLRRELLRLQDATCELSVYRSGANLRLGLRCFTLPVSDWEDARVYLRPR
jgi:hypothetical protein